MKTAKYTRNQIYYSAKVVKDFLSISKRLSARTVDVPLGFDKSQQDELIRKHMDRLLAAGYNVQYSIS